MKIKVDRDEALRYLGYKGSPIPKDIENMLTNCVSEIEEKINARYIYKVFDTDAIDFGGQDIKKHLADCHQCILMAATLGIEADELVKKAQALDMSKAVMLDACGSSGIENACDRIEDMLRGEWGAKGMFVTGRFSPGYGDMPIEQQKSLCGLLDTQRKIGLYVTNGNTMIPIKSVTAVLGISEKSYEASENKKRCDSCSLAETCDFRKEGKNCGK